jgi:hypothetical protein
VAWAGEVAFFLNRNIFSPNYFYVGAVSMCPKGAPVLIATHPAGFNPIFFFHVFFICFASKNDITNRSFVTFPQKRRLKRACCLFPWQ